MRRRGPGVGGIKRHAALKTLVQDRGSELQEDKGRHAKETIETFRNSLEEFALKYQSQIKADPYFRARFQEMCETIGVDPLASSKGIWGELLGLGDFYYELGVRIVEMCMILRPSNGGLVSMTELLHRLNRVDRRKGTGAKVSEDDVTRAVAKLQCLGGGFRLVSLPAAEGEPAVGGGGPSSKSRREKVTMVVSVPLELDLDHTAAIARAVQQRGRVSVGDLAAAKAPLNRQAAAADAAAEPGFGSNGGGLGWTEARSRRVLEALAAQGMAWVDDQASSHRSRGSPRAVGATGGSGDGVDYWLLSVWLDALQQDSQQQGEGEGPGGGEY